MAPAATIGDQSQDNQSPYRALNGSIAMPGVAPVQTLTDPNRVQPFRCSRLLSAVP